MLHTQHLLRTLTPAIGRRGADLALPSDPADLDLISQRYDYALSIIAFVCSSVPAATCTFHPPSLPLLTDHPAFFFLSRAPLASIRCNFTLVHLSNQPFLTDSNNSTG